MVKLYLKKLLYTLVFGVLFLIIFMPVIAFVWVHLASFLQSSLKISFPQKLNYYLALSIALFLELLGVYFLRIDNPRYKEAYKSQMKDEIYAFRADFITTLKSTENISHTSAFLSLFVPYLLLTAVGKGTPLVSIIFRTLMAMIVAGALFALINTLHWCIVHRGWKREKE